MATTACRVKYSLTCKLGQLFTDESWMNDQDLLVKICYMDISSYIVNGLFRLPIAHNYCPSFPSTPKLHNLANWSFIFPDHIRSYMAFWSLILSLIWLMRNIYRSFLFLLVTLTIVWSILGQRFVNLLNMKAYTFTIRNNLYWEQQSPAYWGN